MHFTCCTYMVDFLKSGHNYPPLHCALNAKLKGDKLFQGGPNISDNLAPGVQNLQQN